MDTHRGFFQFHFPSRLYLNAMPYLASLDRQVFKCLGRPEQIKETEPVPNGGMKVHVALSKTAGSCQAYNSSDFKSLTSTA